MSEKTVSVVFRVDEDLKNAFERTAKKRDITVSQLLRGYMRHFIEKYAQEDAQGELLEPAKAAKTVKPANTQPKKQKAPKGAGSALLNSLISRGK